MQRNRSRTLRYLGAAAVAALAAGAVAPPAHAETSVPATAVGVGTSCATTLPQGSAGAAACATRAQNGAGGYSQSQADAGAGAAEEGAALALSADAYDVRAEAAAVHGQVAQVSLLSQVWSYSVSSNPKAGTVGAETQGQGVTLGVFGLVGANPSSSRSAESAAAANGGHGGDNLTNLHYVAHGTLHFRARDNNNRIDGTGKFNFYRSNSASDLGTYFGASHWLSMRPLNGARLRTLKATISPGGGMSIIEADPKRMRDLPAGSMTISAQGSYQRGGASVGFGLSRTWEVSKGKTGGFVTGDEAHRIAWTGKSKNAEGIEGVSLWMMPPQSNGHWVIDALVGYNA